MSNDNIGTQDTTSTQPPKNKRFFRTALGKVVLGLLALVVAIAVGLLVDASIDQRNERKDRERIEKLIDERNERREQFGTLVREQLLQQCAEREARNLYYAAQGGRKFPLSPACNTLVETGQMPRG